MKQSIDARACRIHPSSGVPIYRCGVGWTVYFDKGVWRCLRNNKLAMSYAFVIYEFYEICLTAKFGDTGGSKILFIMKKLVLAVMTTVLPLIATAQITDAQMATLQHGDKTTVFLGNNAFVDAYNAAADSADVITLSAGEFNVPGVISKSISVYGAGFENDTVTGTKRTLINGSLKLKHADGYDDDGNLVKGGKKVDGSYFEGLYFNYDFSFENNNNLPLKNITISKCKFYDSINYMTDLENVIIKQCSFNDFNPYGLGGILKNLLITNCHFRGILNSSTSSVHIDHSICINNGGTTSDVLCTNSILYRCLSSSSTSKNNIFIGRTSTGTNNANDVNWTGLANAGVWAEEGNDGHYSAEKTFELKNPNKYIGTDGTQVGIHGGDYPWNKIPCTPRIIESDIDTKVSAEGKLKVNIKVEAQTKM